MWVAGDRQGGGRAPTRQGSPLSGSGAPVPAESIGRGAERWILALVTLTVLMVSAAGTILTIALPTVVREFDASALAASWMLLISSLISTSLLIICGRLADLLGRRGMFLSGLALFIASATGAGLAPNVEVLLAMLASEAVASSLLLCNTGAIVASIFTGARLHAAMGTYLAGVSVAGLLGPTIGGVMADRLGWEWVFWCQVPLGVVCLLIGMVALRHLPARAERRGTLDVLGATALAIALALFLLGLSMIQSQGLGAWQVWAAMAAFVTSIPVVVWIERRARDPIIPLVLFRSRDFSLANLAGLLSVMPRFTAAVLIGLYFQTVAGDSATQAGLKVVPLAVGVTIGSVTAGRFATRFGERVSAIASSGFTVLGLCGLLAAVELDARYAAIAAPLAVLGVSIGVFATINSSMIIGRAPDSEVGLVNGVRLTVMTVGGAIATAGGLSLATSTLPVGLRAAFYDATLEGRTHLADVKDGFMLAIVAMMIVALLSAAATAGMRDGTFGAYRQP